jgi:GNAT superfamily N-acetyltransferase
MSEVVIRQGTAEDQERVLCILVDAFRGVTIHHWLEREFGQLGDRAWEERKRADGARFLDAHPDWILVAEIEGKVVGFATYFLDRDRSVGEIRNNAVALAHQGKGIGTALYRRLLEIFRAEGMRLAWLETGQEEVYAPARRAYEKVGFRPFHKAVFYVQDLTQDEGGDQ